MKAIKTWYLAPTDYRGARVKASDEDGNTHTEFWDYRLSSADNHADACRALCRKLDWTGRYAGGYLKNSMVWVWVHGCEWLIVEDPK